MMFNRRKTVQVLNYLAARAVPREISKLVALKLVYLADRYHLRKYACPILWDRYVAMQYGPVAVRTRKMIDHCADDAYLRQFLSIEALTQLTANGKAVLLLKSIRAPDMGMISQTEAEALDAALRQWGRHENLVEFTHRFPEWKSRRPSSPLAADGGDMAYADFFAPCQPGDEYCDADDGLVALNKEAFADSAWLAMRYGE